MDSDGDWVIVGKVLEGELMVWAARRVEGKRARHREGDNARAAHFDGDAIVALPSRIAGRGSDED